MNEKTVQFLPFHAINEFMRPDFRQAVILEVLQNQSALSDSQSGQLSKLTKKFVSVPGFRNSSSAPSALRVKPTITAFEKHPEMVAAILAGWAEIHSSLRQEVYDLLQARDWEILPVDADRTKLPGFLTIWPKNESFDALNMAFREANPNGDGNPDEISLMAVWLSGRLPYNLEEDENPEEETPSPASSTAQD